MFPIDNLPLLCAMLTYIWENAQIVILGAVRHVLLHNQAACLWWFLTPVEGVEISFSLKLLTKTSHCRVLVGGVRSLQPDAPRLIKVHLL